MDDYNQFIFSLIFKNYPAKHKIINNITSQKIKCKCDKKIFRKIIVCVDKKCDTTYNS